MHSVLLVSKPVAPPWNDSSKNLAKDLAQGLPAGRATVMVRRGMAESPSQLEAYPRTRERTLVENVAVVGALLRHGRRFPVWHFFFAPNLRSALAGRVITTLVRPRATVQTVCSAPAADADIPGSIFTDRLVVLSASTEQRFLDAGVAASRLCRIPPAIAPLDPIANRREVRVSLGLDPDQPLIVYPGDLEFGGGAESTLQACGGLGQVAVACRTKTPASIQEEARLKAAFPESIWFGETPRIHALLGVADVVALPSRDLYAKMDYPLVLLEAMSMGVPVVVGEGTAAEELTEHGAVAVPLEPDAITQGVERALAETERGERGRHAVLNDFSVGRMVQRYERLYAELL